MRSMPMSETSAGAFRVVAIRAGGNVFGRLTDLGLHVGDRVDVVGQGISGVVIGCGDVRMALDRDTAGKVHVVPLTEVE